MRYSLNDARCRHYRGTFEYLVVPSYGAGRKNVYDVLVLNSEDPVTVGRELPLKDVRALIADYESLADKPWFGDRKSVLTCMRRVTNVRQHPRHSPACPCPPCTGRPSA